MNATKQNSAEPSVSSAAKKLIESVSEVVTVRAGYVASGLIHAALDYATWDDYEVFPLVVPEGKALVVLIVDEPEGLAGNLEIVRE